MTLTKEQHELRRKGIGGSEIAAVAGLSEYMRPIDVWQSKMGIEHDNRNHHSDRGKFLEDGIVEWYKRRTGSEVVKPGTLRHERYHIVIATPDGVADETRVLEVKCPSWRTSSHWGEPGTDQIPDYYLPQVIWEMAVTGLDSADVACFAGDDLHIYKVQWSQQLFEALLEMAHHFWETYVLTKTPPPPDASKSYADYLANAYPLAVEPEFAITDGNDELEAAVSEWRSIKEAEKRLADRKRDAENIIKSAIGSTAGLAGSWGRLRYTNVQGRVATDWRAVAVELGASQEQIEKHTSAGKGFRRMTPTWSKDKK